MSLTVYIQKFKLDPKGPLEFASDITFNAFQGFDAEVVNIIFFENINEVPKCRGIDDMKLVVAFIDDTIEYFKNNNIEIPRPLDIPEELMEFTGRRIEIKTLGQFRKETEFPIFVKPHSKIKAFPSGVINLQSSRKNLTGFKGEWLDDDMEVLTSEVVDMITEYRCFIKNGKLVGMKHYQGDFRIFPSVQIIQRMIEAYTTAPIAYSLDVANVVAENWERTTILVEAQDMWSIGPYGLDPKTYVSLLKARWYEIFRK